jgi:hypothetical protein
MKASSGRYARLRHLAAGAFAALAVVGVIAALTAAAKQPPRQARASSADETPTKTQTPSPGQKAHEARAGPEQPFLEDVQRLVGQGTLSAGEGQVLEDEARSGTVESQVLSADGFSPSQLDAVQGQLTVTKEALGAMPQRESK